MIKVFISYSHDSPEHEEKVRGLHASLCRDGCECQLDVFKDTDEDWPAWMTRQLEEADFILCVITKTYALRFNDQEEPNAGLGVGWEAGLIRRLLYAKKLRNGRIFPVFFARSDQPHIPLALQGYDYFLLDGPNGYETLLRKVLNKPLHAAPAVGTPPKLATNSVAPSFQCPGEAAPATGQSSPSSAAPRVHWADELRIYGDKGLFAGRRAELKLLNRSLREGKTRVLSLWAEGGSGKTRLLFQWLNKLRDDGWRGVPAVFVHSFYSQGSKDRGSASSDSYFDEALDFFGYRGERILDLRKKGSTLAQLVAEARGLVVLDGLEPLQYPASGFLAGELKDQAIAGFLLALTNLPAGLCLISTRQELPELRSRRGAAVTQQPLNRLSMEDGVALLRELEVKGKEAEMTAAVEAYHGHAYSIMLLGTYLREATTDHDISRWREFSLLEKEGEHDHHIEHMLQMYEHHLGADSPELAALRLLGFFDRPATHTLIDVLRAPQLVTYKSSEQSEQKRQLRELMRSLGMPPEEGDGERPQPRTEADQLPSVTQPLLTLSPDDWQRVLNRLSALRLLSLATDGSVDSHPLLREYFAKQLRQRYAEAWKAGHRRLYEHLCASTKEGDQPTLEDLQPLYQAVAHGCQAGLQQEACDKVYFARIARGNEAYAMKKLGAFGSDLGAVACFFEPPWSHLSPALTEADQAWLLNEAATRLRALGRLTEALEPMRAGLPIELKREDWNNAARRASNLSELELTLGAVAGAVGDAEQSVTYADRSGDAFDSMDHRTVHADALHQAGRRAEAEARFREAELMQAERQPAYPLLYSLQGFRYCDLLLADAERAAWQIVVAANWRSPQTSRAIPRARAKEDGGEHQFAATPLLESCRAVSERADTALKIVLNGSRNLLDIALNHLTLGRAALYAAILESCRSRREEAPTSAAARQSLLTSAPTVAPARRELDAAVSGLRRAGQQDELPKALLTRAWLRSLTGTLTGPESAQSDLDEAWEIAERGPMPLFLADIHLHRARLFGKRKAESREQKGENGERKVAAAYPWESPQADLAAARRLIKKHGYLRRQEELADAEQYLLP